MTPTTKEAAMDRTISTGRYRRAAALTGLVTAAALTAACSSSSNHKPATSTTNSGSSSSPTTSTAISPTTSVPVTATTSRSTHPTASSTAAASPADQARAKAVRVVRTYYALEDSIYADPKKPINALHSVLNNFYYGAESGAISNARALGWKASGITRVVYARATKVSLPSKKGGVASVIVKSCVDLRNNKLIDAQGKLKNPHTNKNSFSAELDTVSNYDYPHGSWVITQSTNHFVRSCG